MRIICLEEHVGDRAVAQATQGALAAQAPYMAEVGSRFHDDPRRESADRPRLVDMKQAMAALAEPLEARLPRIDAAEIDMQVVSLAGSTQLAKRSAVSDSWASRRRC